MLETRKVPMSDRAKAILYCLVWSIGCAGFAMLIPFLLRPKPTFLYVGLGVFGAVVGSLLAAMGWAGPVGMAEGIEASRALETKK